jgi:peptidoglycan/LPS O-acetylase OafA/YrhL
MSGLINERSPSGAATVRAKWIRGHIPGLDGVRGLAILVVLIHNVGYFEEPADSLAIKIIRVAIGGGWIGVQLFFVLSGFLITSILLDTKYDAHYFRSFYVRRVLRIFPLYYLTLIVAFLALPRLMDLGDWIEQARRVQIWHWTYLSNWFGSVPGLNHFWSLAVEEQFYLIWPIVVFSLSNDRLIRTCGLLVISALLFRIVMVVCHAPDSWIYTFTITRWDTLGCGAAIAAAMRDPSWYARVVRWLRLGAIPIGVVLLLIAVVDHGLLWWTPLSQTAGYSALALLFGFLILAVVNPSKSTEWLRRVVEARWLRFFGKYSYGIYVLHLPIHQFGVVWLTPWVVGGTRLTRPVHLIAYVAGNLVLSTAAAVVVWRLVERRFLALKDVWGRRDPAAASSGSWGTEPV